MVPSKSSREVEVVRPANPSSLVIPSWRESETNLLPAFGVSHGHEEASIELKAVEREGVDLLACVEPPDEAIAIAPAPAATSDQYVAVP